VSCPAGRRTLRPTGGQPIVEIAVTCRPVRFLGSALHFLWLVLVVTALAIVYGLGRLGTLVLWGARKRRAIGTLRGWTLRQGMTSLGATFIKLGQVMSTRPDLFSPQVIAQLRGLQDRLPPFAYGKAAATIREELGKPVEEVFADFEEQPVAAASVAQVHRAHLVDGTEVAVKILRPGVRRQVERDAAILISGSKLLTIRAKWRLSDPVGHTKHFVDAIHEQTDLRIEAANYTRFAENFAAMPEVKFPKIYPELSTERMLVMEFVRGTKVDALPPEFGGAKQLALAKTIRTAMFKMCFEHGFIHADLHPGNMLVEDSGRLVLFDAGLAKLLHEDILIQFIDMTKCLAMGTADDLVAHLKRFHVYLDGVDWEALRAEVTQFTVKFRGKDVAKLEYGELIGDMFAIARTHHVRPVTDMMLIFVALITAQGIGKMLEPEHNVFAAVAAFLMPILMKRNETIPTTAEARAAGL